MLSALFPKGLPPWLDSGLDRVEQLLWNRATEVDAKSDAFYVYRAYPSSIKSAQLADWVALQKRSLSPFKGGEVYAHASARGVCLWATPTAFSGIPETAMQGALSDGEHWVQGAHHTYYQVWKQGVMTEMATGVSAPAGQTTVSVDELRGTPWAKSRNIDKMLAKPVTWFALAAGLFLFSLTMSLGSWLGIQQQLGSYEDQIASLETSLGDKLALQTRYQQYEQLLSGVEQWQHAPGHLPDTLASVITPVLGQTSWHANVIAWQGGQLSVELESDELDIASLVQSLEARNEFSEVSIRPNAKQNTWDLEVTLNER
ncbi:hypothetical protein [Alteromonas halophila]|uniref:Uncharacterized protein n=1 Tax=Alteromonas halophila TaxID=516698 RepID=A0A918JRH0_9ALTE|nr:hypothetical protein [Alteromonas halophila]GGW92448.1 hypothetical protein GCM10007391_28530 [Alteromonas halophila]